MVKVCGSHQDFSSAADYAQQASAVVKHPSLSFAIYHELLLYYARFEKWSQVIEIYETYLLKKVGTRYISKLTIKVREAIVEAYARIGM